MLLRNTKPWSQLQVPHVEVDVQLLHPMLRAEHNLHMPSARDV